MRDLSPAEVYEYAAEDADITLRLKNVLEPKLKEIECEDLFWNVEMPLVPVLAHMEMTPPPLQRSGSEHRRAVTSLIPMVGI